MAWARVQGASSTESSTAATTKAVTLGAAVSSGGVVCGHVSWENTGSNLSSVTDDKGNTYNLETTIIDTGNGQKNAAYSRSNITNGPTVFTATFSASVGYQSITAEEFSGGSTASTNERDGTAHGGQFQATPGTGTDAVTSGNFTTTTNGCLIFGSTMPGSNTTAPNLGTGFSAGLSNTLTDYCTRTEWLVQTTAGANTKATFTTTIARSCNTFMIAMKPASGAAPAPKAGTLSMMGVG